MPCHDELIARQLWVGSCRPQRRQGVRDDVLRRADKALVRHAAQERYLSTASPPLRQRWADKAALEDAAAASNVEKTEQRMREHRGRECHLGRVDIGEAIVDPKSHIKPGNLVSSATQRLARMFKKSLSQKQF